MATVPQQPRSKLSSLERQLASRRDELRVRLGEHHKGVLVEREPDDEIAAAYDNISIDMLITTLERERKTLAEIELALARMKKGDYGICKACGTRIPEARLRALPWAQCCVQCAAGGAPSRSLD